jgi:hypothetical protein
MEGTEHDRYWYHQDRVGDQLMDNISTTNMTWR